MKASLPKFYRFLESNECLADFLISKDDTFDLDEMLEVYYVQAAFVWHESEKGTEFWSRIDKLWSDELENNNV